MAKKTKKAVKKAAVKKAALRKPAPKKAAVKKASPKKAARKAAPPAPPPAGGRLRGGIGIPGIAAGEMVVIITATFTGVAAGNSSITASFNGEESTRTSSGNITFSGVKQDDLIGIDGTSPGNTKVEINVSATPPEMEFEPGNFNDNFAIN